MLGLIDEVADLLPGKLIIDPSNPIAIAADGTISRTLPDGQSAGEVVAGWLPQGTRFAKAFGTLSAALLSSAAYRRPSPAVLFYVTDDARAATEVGGDLHAFGGLGVGLLDRREAASILGSSTAGWPCRGGPAGPAWPGRHLGRSPETRTIEVMAMPTDSRPPADNRLGRAYAAPEVTVFYDRDRCRHYAECVRGLRQVFDPSRRPWIRADLADPDAIAEVVRRCPTGALHYRLPAGEPEEPARPTTVTSDPAGPLLVRGDLHLSTPDGALAETRAALCGCGRTATQPFCDGACGVNRHRQGGTRDPAPASGKEP